MAPNFASLAFTKEVKSLQEKYKSRASYQRMEERTLVTGLTEFEVDFIQKRDSFYMASIGENGFPYIQHRGGPKGFMKVMDATTIGFIDFSGNKQYITVGNLVTNANVSLIMLDYPAKARLKIYAKAEIIELQEKPELLKLLTLEDYPSKPERIMLLYVEAYDWNCPQHITQRFTLEEIDAVLAPQRAYIQKLEQELKDRK
jgi:uncharacterized protein